MSSLTRKLIPESEEECDKISFCTSCELEFKPECWANIRVKMNMEHKNIMNIDCPNYKSSWNGTCIHYDEEQSEDDNSLIKFCKFTGEQIYLIENCEMRGET